MLKRKIMDDLIAWKNEKNKKSLIINGARQVGKTYIIRKFGATNYKHFVEINFVEHEEYKEIFNGSLNGKDIESQIRLRVPAARDMVAGETLIFLDEIQECPNAITALKFLTIDARFDYIASGSLLGFVHKDVKSYPVGYVKNIKMHSMDFEEFLWANGVLEENISDIKDCFINKKSVHPSAHSVMLQHFKNYIVVGGMPEVVETFIETKDYNKVLNIQKDIIEQYKEDIQKYAPTTEKPKIKACFESIPKHLAQDYKKFRYSYVEPNGKARKFAGSLEWLHDAEIIEYCNNLRIPELPLEGNSEEETFKVYMKDIGLLTAMLEEGSQIDILDGNLGIYKGAIYENVIADIFSKKDKKLYYFYYNSTLEIDFIIRYNGKVCGIEVKSGDNTKSKSLNSLIENWGIKQGIKLSTKNIGVGEQTYNIPLYMAIFL